MTAALDWSIDDIARLTGGDWLAPPPAGAVSNGFAIDTRAIQPGQVFVALPGERVDGHHYLEQAARAGASMAIVTRDTPGPLPCLRVDDATRALLTLASAWREQLRGSVVAVTGSNGKTTTVRLIAATLRPAMSVHHAPKSFNNSLGLPLTLLNAPRDVGAVICEIGMSAPGEIAQLARIASPDVGVVTSVGRAHMGGFEGDTPHALRAIEIEKASLLDHVRAEGWRLAPASLPDDLLGSRDRLLRVGEGGDVVVAYVEPMATGVRFGFEGRDAFVPLLGRHNAHNAAIALSVARILGVPADAAIDGLAHAERAPMRLEPYKLDDYVIINDAYNANPDSMLAALRTLAEIPARRRVAVLGDMLELGPDSELMHREIGREIAATGFGLHRLVTIGRASDAIARAASARVALAIETIDDPTPEALVALAASLEAGDVVLLKGSRGARLERVLDACRARAGEPVS